MSKLPTIAAVAAISSAPATPATVPAPPTATAAMAAATTAVATAAARAATAAALCLGPRFVHDQVSPTEILTVQGVDRAIRIFVIVHFDKGEAARLPGETIADQIDA